MLKQLSAQLVILVSLAIVVGCGDATTDKTSTGKTKTGENTKTAGKSSHDDPEDKPLTDAEKKALKAGIKDYNDALAKIKSYRDTIRKETTTGKPALAHRPLDELALLLEWLSEFAEKSDVAKAKLVDLTKSAQKLNDAFEKLHEKIDAGQKPDYGAVADAIEAEIKTLEGFTPAK